MFGGYANIVVDRAIKLGQVSWRSTYRRVEFRRLTDNNGERYEWIGVLACARDNQARWYIKSYLDGTIFVNRLGLRDFQRAAQRTIMEELAKRASYITATNSIETWRRKPLTSAAIDDSENFFAYLLSRSTN